MFYARVALDLHLPVWIAQWALQPETEEAAPSACLLFGVVLLQDACCFPVAFLLLSHSLLRPPCLPWLSMLPVSSGLLAGIAHFKKRDLEGLVIFTLMKALTHRLGKEGVSEVNK